MLTAIVVGAVCLIVGFTIGRFTAPSKWWDGWNACLHDRLLGTAIEMLPKRK